MIRPLRRIHRNVFLALGLFLPVLFASGLLARRNRPAAASYGQALPVGIVLTEQIVVFDGRRDAVDLYADRADPGSVQFSPEKPLVAPDVLVYWSEVRSSSALPGDARLLGPFLPGTHYSVPFQGRVRGYLVLYSPARQEVLGSFFFEGRS